MPTAKLTSQKSYRYLVFIGRFQPFHLGHKAVIDAALEKAENVIVLIGSANEPRSLRNPFTTGEREQMILGAYSDANAKRIHCVPLADALYNDTRWLKNVQSAVLSVTHDLNDHIGIIGYLKDRSSYYLSLFPHWGAESVANYQNLSATPLRKAYLLGQKSIDDLNNEPIPESTRKFLKQFAETDDFKALNTEANFVADYKRQWQAAPYPPIFATVDAVVVQSGHILLIERGGELGRGQWALPGGFLNPDEALLDAAIRELMEETKLDISENKLKQSYQRQHTFDNPDRSPLGRVISQAFYFELANDEIGLPKIKGSDDAACAFWLPLASLDSKKMFQDHLAIIQKLIGI